MNAPWHKEAEIIAFLRKVAVDSNYPFLTRSASIDSLMTTGDKTMLEVLKAVLTAMPEQTFKKSFIQKVEKVPANM